jgi:hypothetical protein
LLHPRAPRGLGIEGERSIDLDAISRTERLLAARGRAEHPDRRGLEIDTDEGRIRARGGERIADRRGGGQLVGPLDGALRPRTGHLHTHARCYPSPRGAAPYTSRARTTKESTILSHTDSNTGFRASASKRFLNSNST